MYTISSDGSKARVIMNFDAREASPSATFESEVAQVIDKVKTKDGHYDVWIEFSTDAVWSPAIAAKAQALFAESTASGMRKTAIILNSALQRLQMKRASNGSDQFGIFESPAEAESWLAA